MAEKRVFRLMKKILFHPWSEFAKSSKHAPSPAKSSVPEWYKDMPQYFGGHSKLRIFENRHTNMTIKMCPPFLDSMLSGYFLYLETDVYVERVAGKTRFAWGYYDRPLVEGHSAEQIPKSFIPEEYDDEAYKFVTTWSVKLPKGYSALFIHPLNRTDLPFYTLSGIVDVDSFELPVNFPFLLKKSFSGIIKAGTPIAQIIPIKRENWFHKITEQAKQKMISSELSFLKTLQKGYKNNHWHKKSYN